MGLFFNDKEDIKKDVEENFGKGKAYLLGIKHNGLVKSALKLAISDLYYTLDSNRTFVLVFDQKGIYEKEISNSTKTNFYLMPEGEIENFSVEKKSDKALVTFDHIGQKISYEIPFKGKFFKDNQENFDHLSKNAWNKIASKDE